jgi:hypothetical protein
MVPPDGANTNAEIYAPFILLRPETRGSMHPPRPRQADWVARWRLSQRWARGTAGRAGEGRAARVAHASPDGRGAPASSLGYRRTLPARQWPAS